MWFEEVAIHLVISCAPSALLYVAEEWAERYTPILTRQFLVSTLDRMRIAPPFYQSRDIGCRLRLTLAEREKLRITHIAACDVDVQQVEAWSRERRNEAAKAHRLATGATKTPREKSLARTNPRLPGESTGAFYRRVARERRGLDA